MNREIKFRFWNVGNNHWVNPNKIEFTYQDDDNGSIGIPFHLYQEEIIYQQYTGLKDKNGKDIYEGDIVKYQSSNPRFTQVVVRWTKEEEDNHPGWVISDSYCQYGEPEIIGNIFENSELLEA